MKILMLGWELPPHNSGGLGVACYHLCKALAKNDVDIEFILPYKAAHSHDFMTVTAAHPQGVIEIQKAGNAYDSFKYVYESGKEEWLDVYGQQQVYEHSIGRVIKGKTYDVIHAHDWLTFRAALRAKELLGVPLILHVHSIESDRAGGNSGNPLVHEIEKTALLLADRVIAVSELTKQAIIKDYGVPAENIDVVHNSIDTTGFEIDDASNAYHYLTAMKKQGYKVVCNIGRFTIQKNLPNLLYAARDVIARQPKTIFLLVGGGDQYYQLLTLAASLGIARNVVFVGFQRGKQWRDAFRIADLFVMPSVSEPFGLTPLEAIGYGTPALISKQSGVAEIMNNCLKVDFWDVEDMADKIAAVVTHDSLRDELHRNAHIEFSKLTWDHASDKMMHIYHHHRQKDMAVV
ncbi:MAG: putative Glycosyl transferase, group 1 family [Candidatus Saccharibacteria bacterium]|nr:putative Glycosyl transferase, group 1 family [Candidatus Saccharibacteria bacterium]